MNKYQQAKLDKILNQIPRFDYYGRKDDYEVKKLEIHESDYGVYIYIVTGHKGDEGTAAELLCRKHRHFKIGVRGGVKSFISKNKKSVDAQPVTVFELLNSRWSR